jgi:predicted thioesterase
VIAVGLRGEVIHEVGPADLATVFGSGLVEVLATPKVLALCEGATVAAVAGALDAGTTTVGTHVELDHLAPSPSGVVVRASAELVEVDRRRLVFDVVLTQGEQVCASGRVVRAVVDIARFMAGMTPGVREPASDEVAG